MIRNTRLQWGAVAKTLHWIMALAILIMFALGWLAASAPVSPTKLKLFMWHKSIGLTLLGLVCVRLFWRFTNQIPAPPPGISSTENTLARLGHAALYALMIAMPLSGYVINSTANFPFKLFGWLLVPNVFPADKAWQGVAESIHFYLFWTFVVVITIHVAAALRHHLLKHNDVLKRMLPTRAPPP